MAGIVGTITNLSDFLSKTQVCLSVKPNDPQQQIICLEADRKYSIPAFQREVRWDDNNLKMLLYDLSRSSKFLGNIASIDKGTRGSAGRKCPHTASKPLRIHKVFSAAFSLSASISAPAELLRIGQPWIFEGFLFFWTQAGCRPPRTKGQKAPKRLAVRRVCSC